MSTSLFGLGGLRFWSGTEINLREAFVSRMQQVVSDELRLLNPAWRIERCEGPILHPRNALSPEYTDDDIFVTNDIRGGDALCLRAETTASSYLYAKSLANKKLPLCVWQSGISSRREINDGASAAKMRYNCFYQLEFQCIYSITTGMDYRASLMAVVAKEIRRFTSLSTCETISDRLPSYSESTLDIEVEYELSKWREVASCSIRNDFSDDTKVCEIAIGLDRIVEYASKMI